MVAPVTDGFRAPPHPYGPGNRGIEYDTKPGDPVLASADGQVVFAGSVAGSRHVTVLHADGVRTSYSYLDEIRVAVGQRVRQGDQVGVAGERFHFGARLGDAYFDPASLFGTTTVEVELLPFEVPPGATADEERAALTELAFGRGGGGLSLPSLGDAAGWMLNRVELVQHYVTAIDPVRRSAGLAWDVTRRLTFPPPCTDGPAPVRPAARRPRVAVLVGGLGSSSESASVDDLRTGELGYADDDVLRFSYNGGRTPGTGDGFTHVPVHAYRSSDTQGDLRVSARRLADAIEAAAAEHPEALVDVYAHSMGGVVTRLALIELQGRGVDLGRLGLVATLGSPHRGADLATAVAAANATPLGDVATDVASDLLDTGLDPDAPAVAQLAETSDVVDEIAAAGVPDGVELVSLAASGDVVVPSPDTEVDGARNVTVGVTGRAAHGDLVGSDAATDELALALADEPPRCESALGVVGE
ncbi:MAG TPA: peptidoglycan DD-metalloendopeptidase family protein, partial [Acidimicrobiales bacterium]|nr:peptidoglycan DD-metalloendopeptidase family protein [Acidimicrobiales bacterium]